MRAKEAVVEAPVISRTSISSELRKGATICSTAANNDVEVKRSDGKAPGYLRVLKLLIFCHVRLELLSLQLFCFQTLRDQTERLAVLHLFATQSHECAKSLGN